MRAATSGFTRQVFRSTTEMPASVDDRHAIDFYGAVDGIGEAVTIFTFES